MFIASNCGCLKGSFLHLRKTASELLSMMLELLSTAEPLYLEYLFAFTLAAAACFAGSYRARQIPYADTRRGRAASSSCGFRGLRRTAKSRSAPSISAIENPLRCRQRRFFRARGGVNFRVLRGLKKRWYVPVATLTAC